MSRPALGVPLMLRVVDHVPLPIPVPAPGAAPLELRPTRAPEYLLRLADGLAMPAGGWRLGIAPTRQEQPPVEPRVSVAELGYRAWLAPGRFRATAIVPYHGAARSYASCEIDVPAADPGEGNREIRLPFDPAEWAALLAPEAPGD